MKTITLTILACMASQTSGAQSFHELLGDRDMLKIIIAVICMGIVMIFILAMFKRFFEYQLKSKALDLRVPEELASVILKDKSTDERIVSIRWSFIFAGLGVGFTIISFTSTRGAHSIAVLTLSLAIAFFGHYCYLRFREK
jgi:hypothetical protein